MTQKHAYLIMAHDKWWQLEKLISALDHPDNDIFLHVDVRAKGFDQKRMETLCAYSGIHIYRQFAVHWGRYEQIRTEMLLFEKAFACGRMDFTISFPEVICRSNRSPRSTNSLMPI